MQTLWWHKWLFLSGDKKQLITHYLHGGLELIFLLIMHILFSLSPLLLSPEVKVASHVYSNKASKSLIITCDLNFSRCREDWKAFVICVFFSPESEVTTVNLCLDAAKACNIDETCQKLRTEYVSACIQPSARSGPCNQPKCNKALRKFFDRVPPDYTHELLFCPCTDTACAERRRQTIVPSCSYEEKDKPNCLVQLRICKADYVCR